MSIIAGFIDVFVWVGMYTYVGTPHVLTYLKLGSGYLKNSLYFLYEHFFFSFVSARDQEHSHSCFSLFEF